MGTKMLVKVAIAFEPLVFEPLFVLGMLIELGVVSSIVSRIPVFHEILLGVRLVATRLVGSCSAGALCGTLSRIRVSQIGVLDAPRAKHANAATVRSVCAAIPSACHGIRIVASKVLQGPDQTRQ